MCANETTLYMLFAAESYVHDYIKEKTQFPLHLLLLDAVLGGCASSNMKE